MSTIIPKTAPPQMNNNAAAVSIASMSELAPLLVRRRKALGLSQDDLADAIGLSRRSIYAIERGKPTALIENVLKVCAALGVTIEARA